MKLVSCRHLVEGKETLAHIEKPQINLFSKQQ